jgi:flavodoxin
MNAVVLYATRSGNTRRVAEAIAEGLRVAGPVDVHCVDAAPGATRADADLVVLGGPTEGRHMTPQMLEFIARLPAESVRGRAAAAFDTRVDWPRWLSGSAADDIRRELERRGARGPIPSESFIVTMKPVIRPEELDRARAWGAQLAARYSSSTPAIAGR